MSDFTVPELWRLKALVSRELAKTETKLKNDVDNEWLLHLLVKDVLLMDKIAQKAYGKDKNTEE